MNSRLDIDWSQIGKKWVACFDLLGFSEFVKGNDLFSVFYRWELCFAQFQNNLRNHPKLNYAHFSDTFLIYASDDSLGVFHHIESCSRWFFDHALLYRLPLRGAMACNELYADRANGVFLGKALVEAHEYGQQFNWIGYTLAPTVLARLEHIPSHFRKAIVQTRSNQEEETVALLCGLGKGRDYIRALCEMKQFAVADLHQKGKLPGEIASVEAKYDNAIKFIEKFETATDDNSPAL
jgi:hypothetical protein